MSTDDDGHAVPGAPAASEMLSVLEAPAAPDGAREYLGAQFELMRQYVDHLAGTAIHYGLIGPRERPSLWTRHVLNCAVLGELIDQGQTVADVGSGAGLPGLVIAIARPDVSVTLIEPLLRRSTWLQEVVDDLDLSNVVVRRDRAEAVTDLQADVVTSRAVARLDKLVGWSAPLVRPGGRILAIKGASADSELAECAAAVARSGVVASQVRVCGEGLVDPATVVIELVTTQEPRKSASTRGAGRGRKRASRSGPRKNKP